MSSEEACCTCASLLYSTIDSSEKLSPQLSRRTNCCGRAICDRCVKGNPRFASYCPFCQISSAPSALPHGGLRDPPSYTPPEGKPPAADKPPATDNTNERPPAYSETDTSSPVDQKDAPDVLHFLSSEDTIPSLSLRYGVPQRILRNHNNLYSDHLLSARKTLLIPGSHYKGGVSLSPRPPGGEEEERRKGIIRRFMMSCKVSDYDVALLYLKQAEYELETAVRAYREDEAWEKEHPMQKAKGKSKAKRSWFGGAGGGLTGQLR